jgi:DNA-binding transcriptional ArsR family regulator
MSAASTDITPVFFALADPTRRHLLDLLAESGFASATALAAHVPISRQAVLKHLRVLEDAAVVGHERAGREVRYHVRPEPLTASARWLTDRANAWDRRLAALKRAAEAGSPPRAM